MAVGLMALTGCASGGIAQFDEPRGSEDVLPGSVRPSEYQRDSVHLLVEHEGVTYFLAKPVGVARTDEVCAIAYRDDEAWVGSCSRGGAGEFHGTGVGTTRFVSDSLSDARVPEGWVRVHPNLLVKE